MSVQPHDWIKEIRFAQPFRPSDRRRVAVETQPGGRPTGRPHRRFQGRSRPAGTWGSVGRGLL